MSVETRDFGRMQLYFGTTGPAVSGRLLAGTCAAGTPAERILDGKRKSEDGVRSMAIGAALTVLDATATASIRAYSRTEPVPHEAIRVYRVELVPFHAGPVAILDEVKDRLAFRSGTSFDSLVSAYWRPTAPWHLMEILATSLTILEEVPATPERDTYFRRWVQYNEDRRRAEEL